MDVEDQIQTISQKDEDEENYNKEEL